jgi:hypothetical protein
MSRIVRIAAEVLEKGHLVAYGGEHYKLFALPPSISYWIGALIFVPLVTLVLRHGEQASMWSAWAFASINGAIAAGWQWFLDLLIKIIQWMKL